MNVLILHKVLEERPFPPRRADVVVNPLRLPADIRAWLDLRQRAFADLKPSVRPWTEADFLREFGMNGKAPRRFTWLARPDERSLTACCGAVSLTLPRKTSSPASLHWLMVDPTWRRRGIGGLLLSHAEACCWDHGRRNLRLETHRGWQAAVRFYWAQGFE